MRRKRPRKSSFIDTVALLPWYIGILLGIGLFVWIKSLEAPILSTLAFLPLVGCWIGAYVSFARKHERKRLYNQQKSLQTLFQLSWQEFEKLVGEYFRQKGFKVFETGLGGPDGGVDLVLQQHNKTYLVQCKHWKRKSIPVTTVREMWGLRDHHKTQGVKIVSVGIFTQDALLFAQQKDIELISGHELIGLIKGCSGELLSHKPTPVCPSCNNLMHERTNKQTQQKFWGCSSFPKCRTTRPFS